MKVKDLISDGEPKDVRQVKYAIAVEVGDSVVKTIRGAEDFNNFICDLLELIDDFFGNYVEEDGHSAFDKCIEEEGTSDE